MHKNKKILVGLAVAIVLVGAAALFGKFLTGGSFTADLFDVSIPTNSRSIRIKPAQVREQIKCVFSGSNKVEKCYSDNSNSCSGSGTCVADVSGPKGQKLTWKSSCGGYAYTTMDGKGEYAEFKCPQSLCGNGVIDLGEQCDDGNLVDGDSCSAKCQKEVTPIAKCGNGIVESSEQCDDGNYAMGDGCKPSCYIEGDWSCAGSPSVCAKNIATPTPTPVEETPITIPVIPCPNGTSGIDCGQNYLIGGGCQPAESVKYWNETCISKGLKLDCNKIESCL